MTRRPGDPYRDRVLKATFCKDRPLPIRESINAEKFSILSNFHNIPVFDHAESEYAKIEAGRKSRFRDLAPGPFFILAFNSIKLKWPYIDVVKGSQHGFGVVE